MDIWNYLSILRNSIRLGSTFVDFGIHFTPNSTPHWRLFIIRAHYSIDHEKQHIYDEIEGLANDASFDLSEQLIVWDKLRLTKGIGTPLEGHDEKIAEIHHRLVAARDEITAAESPQHQLEAVLAADSVIATAKSLL